MKEWARDRDHQRNDQHSSLDASPGDSADMHAAIVRRASAHGISADAIRDIGKRDDLNSFWSSPICR
jgi:hypothetical protein